MVKISTARERLTVDRIRQVMEYDPDTGVFMWRDTGKGRPLDRIAGTMNHANGYRYVMVDGAYCLHHRLAWFYMTGRWPTNTIDHIDNDKLNNRWINLREATQQQNSANMGKRRDNSTGYKGVTVDRRTGRFIAQIMVKRKHIQVGSFETALEASEAYIAHARALHGEFARAA